MSSAISKVVLAAAVMLAPLSACSSDDARQAAAGQPPAACTSPEEQQASPDGSNDVQQWADGDVGNAINGEPLLHPPEEIFGRHFRGLAVVSVEARRPPRAVVTKELGNGALPSEELDRPALPGARDFLVVRSAQLRVDRQIRGSMPPCLEVDVPGGSAGTFHTTDPSFPEAFAVGDRFLATFSPEGEPPGIHQMLPVDSEGNTTFPFDPPLVVHVDDWVPPPLLPGAR